MRLPHGTGSCPCTHILHCCFPLPESAWEAHSQQQSLYTSIYVVDEGCCSDTLELLQRPSSVARRSWVTLGFAVVFSGLAHTQCLAGPRQTQPSLEGGYHAWVGGEARVALEVYYWLAKPLKVLMRTSSNMNSGVQQVYPFLFAQRYQAIQYQPKNYQYLSTGSMYHTKQTQ